MISRHSDDIDIETGGIPAEKPAAKHASPAWHVLYILPAINTVNDASQVAMALRTKPAGFMIAAAATQAVTSFATDAAQTVKTFRDTSIKLTSEKRPPITGKMYAAGAAAAIITIYFAASNAIEAWFFAESIPGELGFKTPYWTAASSTLTTASALTSLMTQSIYCYTYIAGKLHGNKYKYTNKLSSYVSPAISITSGIISGVNYALSTTVSNAEVLNIKPPYFYALATTTLLLSGFAKYVTSTVYLNEAIDEIFATLSERRPHPREVIIGMFALAGAIYLACATQELAVELLDDAAAIFGTAPNDAIKTGFNAFSFAAAASDAPGNTACVYELTSKLVTGVESALNSIYNKVAGWCSPHNGYSRLDDDNDDIPRDQHRIDIHNGGYDSALDASQSGDSDHPTIDSDSEPDDGIETRPLLGASHSYAALFATNREKPAPLKHGERIEDAFRPH